MNPDILPRLDRSRVYRRRPWVDICYGTYRCIILFEFNLVKISDILYQWISSTENHVWFVIITVSSTEKHV